MPSHRAEPTGRVANALLSLLASVLADYADRRSQNALLGTVKELVLINPTANVDLLVAFLPRLFNGPFKPGTVSARQVLLLVRWLAAPLGWVPAFLASAEGAASLSALLALQAKVHGELLASDGLAAARRAFRLMAAPLAAAPSATALVPALADAVVRLGAASPGSAVSAALAGEAFRVLCAGQPPKDEAAAAARTALIDKLLMQVFAKHTLATRVALPDYLVRPFVPLFALVDEARAEALAAPLGMALYRTVEPVANVVSLVFMHAGVEAGLLLSTQGQGALLSTVRSSSANARQLGLQLMRTLARWAAADRPLGLAATLLAMLTGAGADKLTSVQHRQAALEAMEALVPEALSSGSEQPAALARGLLTDVLGLLEKERNEAMVAGLLHVAGRLQGLLGSDLLPGFVTACQTALKGSKSTGREPALVALAHAVAGSSGMLGPALAEGLLPRLGDLLPEAAAAAIAGAAGPGEFLLLARLAALAPVDLLEPLVARHPELLLTCSSKATAPLLSTRMLDRLTGSQATTLLEVVVRLLATGQEGGPSPLSAEVAGHLCDSFVRVAVAGPAEARRALRAGGLAALPGPAHAGALLASLRALVESGEVTVHGGAALLAQVARLAARAEAGLPGLVHFADRSCDLAHHPRVMAAGEPRRRFWTRLLKHLGAGAGAGDEVAAGPEALAAAALPAIVARLLSPERLASPEADLRASVHEALAELALLCPADTLDAVLVFADGLPRLAETLTPEDLGIYRTPVGQLFRAPAPVEGSGPSGGSARAPAGGARRPGAGAGPSKAELEAIEAQRQAEQAVRTRVTGDILLADSFLDLVRELLARGPEIVALRIPDVIARVLRPAIAFGPLSDKAIDTFMRLSLCLPSPFGQIDHLPAAVLKALDCRPAEAGASALDFAQLAELMEALYDPLSTSGPLPGPAFSFIVPLLRAVVDFPQAAAVDALTTALLDTPGFMDTDPSTGAVLKPLRGAKAKAAAAAAAAAAAEETTEEGGEAVPARVRAARKAVADYVTTQSIVADLVSLHAVLLDDPLLPRNDLILALAGVLNSRTDASHLALDSLNVVARQLSAAGNVSPLEYGTLLGLAASPEAIARLAMARAFNVLPAPGPGTGPEAVVRDLDQRLTYALWLLRHDQTATNFQEHIRAAAEASAALTHRPGQLDEDFLPHLLGYLVSRHADVRASGIAAVRAALDQAAGGAATGRAPTAISARALKHLLEEFATRIRASVPELDKFGRPIITAATQHDHFEARVTLAQTIEASARHFASAEECLDTLHFMVGQAFADIHARVREAAIAAMAALIAEHGGRYLDQLMSPLDAQLNEPDAGTIEQDRVREAVVSMVGHLTVHLGQGNTTARVVAVVERLLNTLATPSEPVQYAVAQCLPLLTDFLPADTRVAYTERMLGELFSTDSYVMRRGAACGAAGLLRGQGLPALKRYHVVDLLESHGGAKASTGARQAGLFLMEALSRLFGRSFDPYLVKLLPVMLAGLGQSETITRQAASAASESCMRQIHLSTVRLLLPLLHEGLQDRQWRTRASAAELLGLLATLAPRALGSFLPSLVPTLVNTLVDAHEKVGAAARAALQHISSCITNPEMQSLAPLLLPALADPARGTLPALRALLGLVFAHMIDSASLALLMPVLIRGLSEPTSDVRRISCQIVTNISALVDPADLLPYVPQLEARLRVTLLDPFPEVRKISARALGTLVTAFVDEQAASAAAEEDALAAAADPATGRLATTMRTVPQMPGLLSWLYATVESQSSLGAVERSGAANGLAEVLYCMDPTGAQLREHHLPAILEKARSPLPHVRDGYMNLLVYLPSTFTTQLESSLNQLIPVLLQALADESEMVRETAMRAGQMLITNFSESATELLLPRFQEGLFNENWRIRQSSVTLLGTMLFHAIGASGKTQTTGLVGENDGIASAQSQAIILELLGRSRRDTIMSSLYLLHSDTHFQVRSTSLHVWKTVVRNTSQMLGELMAVLIRQVIGLLSSDIPELNHLGVRGLGDLVNKFSDRILQAMVPVLSATLLAESGGAAAAMATAAGAVPSEQARLGATLALQEVLAQAETNHLLRVLDDLSACVRVGLCDPCEEVRTVAARAFSRLVDVTGGACLEEIVSQLLAPLLDESLEPESALRRTALSGLKEVAILRGPQVFPLLMERLFNPLTVAGAHILGQLIPFAGQALSQHLSAVLDSIVGLVVANPAERGTLLPAAGAMLASLDSGSDALRVVLSDLRPLVQHNRPEVREFAHNLLAELLSTGSGAGGDAGRAAGIAVLNASALVRLLGRGLNDPAEEVTRAALAGLDALVAATPKANYPDNVHLLRQTVLAAAANAPAGGATVAALNLPRGTSSLAGLYVHALLNGHAAEREQAALALADLLRLTRPEAFRTSTLPVAGALIRLLADMSPAAQAESVRVAVLGTLHVMLKHLGPALRPFIPQLQTTLLRALGDEGSAAIRAAAVPSVGAVAVIHTRPLLLLTELQAQLQRQPVAPVREALFRAAAAALRQLPAEQAAPVALAVHEPLAAGLLEIVADRRAGRGLATAAVDGMAALLGALGPEEAHALLSSLVQDLEELAAAVAVDDGANRESLERYLDLLGRLAAERAPGAADEAAAMAAAQPLQRLLVADVGLLRQLHRTLRGLMGVLQSRPAGAAVAQAIGQLLAFVSLLWTHEHGALAEDLLAVLAGVLQQTDNDDVRLAAAGAVRLAAKLRPNELAFGPTPERVHTLAPALVTASAKGSSPTAAMAQRALVYLFALFTETDTQLQAYVDSGPDAALPARTWLRDRLLAAVRKGTVKVALSDDEDDDVAA
ncbi:hypothetical protein H696_05352 [Fonticula alba]|uniref:TOG domain-containing protein n=1 Tax=Fonticula alba TaxID=691883 RepID=A0A058Z1G8_FONAL|nr:hypothetical protein H696_05352 [Fonticula alba]KCV68100.1 hypothetical protein H696_05352 [Fonticula alba]|eukprot:XP_009497474.1 hypothetical protein H696_05352 [Fonticula alba]